jgi:hypothetical protein
MFLFGGIAMTFLFKKITTVAASFLMVGGIAISAGINQRSDYELDAAFSGATTVYLDKTYIVSQLGWWDTDDTYLHYWTSTTLDQQIKMTRVPVSDNSKIYYKVTIPENVVTLFSTDGGFRFFVYNRDSNQNQTEWINGASWKSQSYNLFDIDTANTDAQQHMDWYISSC